MPPLISTLTSRVATTRASSSRLRPAAEGGVEVDEVHPLGAVALPLQRRLDRVAVRRLAARLALHQADGLAVGDVDGGQQLAGTVIGSFGTGRARARRSGAASIGGDDDQADAGRARSARATRTSATATSQPRPSAALSRHGSGGKRRMPVRRGCAALGAARRPRGRPLARRAGSDGPRRRLPRRPAAAAAPRTSRAAAPALPLRRLAGVARGRAHSVATQFASSAAPASPLFSGWNCVADSTPRSTAAAKRVAVHGGGRQRVLDGARRAARRRSGRSRSAPARARRTAPSPRAPRRCSSPCAARRGPRAG